MTVYLGSPTSPMHADKLAGMPVLLSYAQWNRSLEHYWPTFERVMLDSGAYSEHSGAAKVDVHAYHEWAAPWVGVADGIAGLDDIGGDWKRSLQNYDAVPFGFPTFHDSDPHELLDDEIIPRARLAYRKWLGIGMTPHRRHRLGVWLQETLERIPEDLHVHGFALRGYWNKFRRIDSVDSMNWRLDARKVLHACPWLTPAECVEIIVKRYRRERRTLSENHPLLWNLKGNNDERAS